MKIEIKILDKEFYNEFDLPGYSTSGSAALDLRVTEDVVLYPGERKLLTTGLAIWIGSERFNYSVDVSNGVPFGDEVRHMFQYAGLILPRSGLGTKGLVLANTVGLIDEDYKDELMISAWNRNLKSDYSYESEITGRLVNSNSIELKAGDRIAQLMFTPVIKSHWDVVEEFSDATIERGSFGSTGK